jgi:hypothetical protein
VERVWISSGVRTPAPIRRRAEWLVDFCHAGAHSMRR